MEPEPAAADRERGERRVALVIVGGLLDETLPEALRRAHNTKAGTWGLLRVQTGVLRFALDQEPFTEVVLTAGQCVVIEPQILHHVEFELPGSFQIEFFKQAR